jgi:uncharacterized protein YndB with AHSA1/START domain
MAGFVATAETTVEAPPSKVWSALTDPELISRYMMGSHVETDWRPGSPISWRGEYEGKSYEDRGEVLEVVPERLLTVTHFSPLSGEEDEPENYHTVSYTLDDAGGNTRITLTQDNNASEQAAARSAETWSQLLAGLKEVVESS